MPALSIVVGWSVVSIIDLLAGVVLFRIVTGQIDISALLSEPTGGASMSRFQLLVFTYVIGLTLFWVTVSRQPPAFPEITGGLLSLMGISASTYAVSKGIQFSAGDSGPMIALDRANATLEASEHVSLTATVTGAGNPGVTWSYAPAIGRLEVTGNRASYTAPAVMAVTTTVIVTATSSQDSSVAAAATITVRGNA